ncbi:hypothetical protein [Clostridium uliginosum]|uniref:Uncharacterized protein n=1 Tax=Clostridium uliginosum TaxID=119641 RepID=A0A1I1R055_9CLOT|nr:hypothetical protein [Clostridium uliginosum]SFD25498.1 hypothetical protein SAMN05421842_12744 [Clostridium uliginosum]
MKFGENEIELKDGTTCILRSPDEHDAEKMINCAIQLIIFLISKFV